MSAPASPEKSARVASVDALRGFSVFWLLGGEGAALALGDVSKRGGPFIQSAGNFIATQFTHADWEGFRFWDLIFPLLIFVTGIAIVFSLPKVVEREGQGAAYVRIFRRAALLVVLGIIYYGGLSKFWPDIRLMGVLQRIGLAYLFAALLFLNLDWRGLIASCVVILVGYWAVMTFVPVPGVGAGQYEPNLNLANWIDANYLPGKQFDGNRDPEGMLSTIPAVATCVIGALAGLLLQSGLTPGRKALIMIAGGAVMTLAGYLWGLQFPVVKALWTSSFVLVSGGYSLMLLGVFYVIMDIWKLQTWATIFIWIGANALALYFINGIAGFEPFAKRLVGGNVAGFLADMIGTGAGRFLTHVVALAIATALAAYLYRRRIFIRV
jgi:predicted acyltransferase